MKDGRSIGEIWSLLKLPAATPEGYRPGGKIHSWLAEPDRPHPLRSLGHVRSLRAFLTFSDFEFHLVAFLQAFIPLGGNRAVMHKNIRAIRAPDEPVPLG